jgi:hypothetical protein
MQGDNQWVISPFKVMPPSITEKQPTRIATCFVVLVHNLLVLPGPQSSKDFDDFTTHLPVASLLHQALELIGCQPSLVLHRTLQMVFQI